MAWTTAATMMHDSDELRVDHNPARRTDYGTDLEEAVHVMFGDVDVFGPLDCMAEVLSQALTQVQSIIDNKEENG